jgi:hypothetical protein
MSLLFLLFYSFCAASGQDTIRERVLSLLRLSCLFVLFLVSVLFVFVCLASFVCLSAGWFLLLVPLCIPRGLESAPLTRKESIAQLTRCMACQ